MYKVKMLIKVLPAVLLPAIISNGFAQASEPELMTLFTTVQERELIDNNRYKSQQVEARVVAVEEPQQQQQIEKEEVSLTVRLAGVTISKSGQNVAWVNGETYENGAQLEDGSTVHISNKLNSLVQIQTPDGKYHSVVTGETIDIFYFKRIEG